YRKYGLEVEIANLDGGSRAVAAIVSGDAPIGVLNAGSVVDARLQGTDVKVLAGLFDTYYFQIYSQPALRSAAELRDRTIAAGGAWVSEHGDVWRAFLRAYAEGLALVKRDPVAAKRAIGRYTETDDPALLEESYVAGIPQLPDVPWVREEIIRGALATSDDPR